MKIVDYMNIFINETLDWETIKKLSEELKELSEKYKVAFVFPIQNNTTKKT